MKTTSDVIDLAYSIVYESSLRTEITGVIYKRKRRLNSELEDIVINSLPLGNLDVQQGVINVNIHVPDLKLPTNPVDFQPDTARLKELGSIGANLFKKLYKDDYLFEVENENVIQDDHDHFVNLRVSFYSPKQ